MNRYAFSGFVGLTEGLATAAQPSGLTAAATIMRTKQHGQLCIFPMAARNLSSPDAAHTAAACPGALSAML